MRKDNTDDRILEFLRKDSRESFVEIGKKLKLSESAIRHRVKNMVDSGTITKFTIEEGGGQPEALVLVSADSSIDTSVSYTHLTLPTICSV